MLKRDAAIAIPVAAVLTVFCIWAPSSQQIARALFAWSPLALALLVLGVYIGRRRGPSPMSRLIAGLGLAWISFIALVVVVVFLGLFLIGLRGP